MVQKNGMNCIMRLLFNAWIIYRREKDDKETFLNVMKSAVTLLTGMQSTPKGPRRGRKPSVNPPTNPHIQVRIPATEKKIHPMKRC